MKEITEETERPDDNPLRPPDVREEISAIRETLSHTQSELTRLRRRVDRLQANAESYARRGILLWIATVLASIGLIAALWYGGVAQSSFASQSPSQSPATPGRSSIDKIETATPTDNTEIRETSESGAIPPSPSEPIANPPNDNKLPSTSQNVDDAKPSNEIQKPKPDPLLPAQNASGISTKTSAASDPEQRSNSAATRGRIFSDSINRTRVDFRLPNNHTQEVSPGIFLTVRSTNVELQQIDGWLQVAEDGKTVWLRNQSAEKVVTFATKRDARNRGLVFTRIEKQGVSGYVLIPATIG